MVHMQFKTERCWFGSCKVILASGRVWLPGKSEWVTNRTGSWGRWPSRFHSPLRQGTSRPLQGTLCGSSLSWRSWHHLPRRRQQADPANWVQRAAPWGSAERDSRDARTGRQMCLAKCEDGLRSKYMCAEMSFPLSKLTAMSLEVFKWKPRNSWPPKPLLSALQTLVVLVKRHHPIISSNLKRILCSIWEVLVPTQHSITENVFDMNKGRETKKWNWNHIFISLFR